MADSFSNPFEDPSIKEAKGNENNQQETLENFNPFADNFKDKEPAVIQTNEPSSTNYQQDLTEQLKKQQEELEKKAREIEEREQRVNQRIVGTDKNFPPLPLCCPIKPCFRQDINVDIPQRYQLFVRQHFIHWLTFCGTMVVNMIAALCYVLSNNSETSGTTFGLSILYLIIFPPLVYILCFRSVYNAFKKDSSISFLNYFLANSILTILLIIWCIGIPGSGGVGFISGISTATSSHGSVGVFMVVVGVFFALLAATLIVFIIKTLRYFRNIGGIQQAQQEVASQVVNNDAIRGAAINAVANNFSENAQDRY